MRVAAATQRGLGGPFAVFCGLLAGCSDDPLTCTLADCGGSLPSTQLVDDMGQPALARGEQRTRQMPSPLFFDCTVTLMSPGPPGQVACENGVIFVGDNAYPGNDVELRFELPDGSFTEWQEVELSYTSHTDPDFNGPGCSCTWYTATATPVLVPALARLE